MRNYEEDKEEISSENMDFLNNECFYIRELTF